MNAPEFIVGSNFQKPTFKVYAETDTPRSSGGSEVMIKMDYDYDSKSQNIIIKCIFNIEQCINSLQAVKASKLTIKSKQ